LPKLTVTRTPLAKALCCTVRSAVRMRCSVISDVAVSLETGSAMR
jgi:hypothetical protein